MVALIASDNPSLIFRNTFFGICPFSSNFNGRFHSLGATEHSDDSVVVKFLQIVKINSTTEKYCKMTAKQA